jgi:2-polyprenyl-6-methoxyphenol hydroxylase-like FAD-dependent oxidoreductase
MNLGIQDAAQLAALCLAPLRGGTGMSDALHRYERSRRPINTYRLDQADRFAWIERPNSLSYAAGWTSLALLRLFPFILNAAQQFDGR